MTPMQALSFDQFLALGGFMCLALSLVVTLMWRVFTVFREISRRFEIFGTRLTVIETKLGIENDFTRDLHGLGG